MTKDNYVTRYLREVREVVFKLNSFEIEQMIDLLVELRTNSGRLYFLGVGGGAGNASHAVNDFRKICGIEAYAPTDNVCELTARTNDSGWQSVFVDWLVTGKLGRNDGVFVFSVGGGNKEKDISVNIVNALEYSKSIGAKIFGIVGRDGGYTGQVADACVIVPTISADTVTAHTESFQAVVWHLIVSHPKMKVAEMKWESVK